MIKIPYIVAYIIIKSSIKKIKNWYYSFSDLIFSNSRVQDLISHLKAAAMTEKLNLYLLSSEIPWLKTSKKFLKSVTE